MFFLLDPFFYEIVISGLLAGVMYALVALGFVLIFKASGIFNFSQGVLALFAALTLVGFQTGQIPFAHLLSLFGFHVTHWGAGFPTVIAILFSLFVMIGLAWLIVQIVLKPLVNQEGIILFMATIGLAYVLEGVGDLMWGANVKMLDVGLPKGPSEFILDTTDMFIDKLEISAAVVAIILVVVLTLFSAYTKMGRALRAVADDHQAALSVGISLETIWWIVWSVSGIVALVAGVMWGAKSGAAVSLKVWLHQQNNKSPGPEKINIYSGRDQLIKDLVNKFHDKNIDKHNKQNVIVIGGLGRVGKGATELARSLDLDVTVWDVDETKHGGPFPEILNHNIFINCILARPGVPIFVPHSAVNAKRRLSVISDVSCDPGSPYNPIPIYEVATSFAKPVLRVTEKTPALDVTAIDNLPSMLPVESSEDFSVQILPALLELKNIDQGPWAKSHRIYLNNI